MSMSSIILVSMSYNPTNEKCISYLMMNVFYFSLSAKNMLSFKLLTTGTAKSDGPQPLKAQREI